MDDDNVISGKFNARVDRLRKQRAALLNELRGNAVQRVALTGVLQIVQQHLDVEH